MDIEIHLGNASLEKVAGNIENFEGAHRRDTTHHTATKKVECD